MKFTTLGAVALFFGALAHAQVDATTFDEMKYLASVASDAYNKNCASPEGTFKIAKWEAAIRGFLSIDAQRKWIIASFRGTDIGAGDLAVDLDHAWVPYTLPSSELCTGGCKAARGMHDSAKKNIVAVIDDVKKAMVQYPGYRVIATGHSLGGAYTSIVGTSLAYAIGPGNLTGYGFAAPRFGNEAWAKHAEKAFPGTTMHRVTSLDDGVPQDVKRSEGFMHAGTEYWMSKNPPTAADIKICSGSEDPTCNAKAAANVTTPMGINAAHMTYFVIQGTGGGKCTADPAKTPK